MSAITFRFPGSAFDALVDGDLSVLQFTILVMLYRRANWKTGVVRSISADQVIRALGETGLLPADSTLDARQRLIQRAMKAMRLAGWFKSDYQSGSRRPYNITLTNYLSLCAAETAHAENDADGIVLNPGEITPCAQPSLEFDADNDADIDADVSLRCRGRVAEMSANNQGKPNPEREIPLNPPSGDFSPAPLPPGGERSPRGSKPTRENLTGKENQLHDVAVLYANFSVWLYSFSPNVTHVEALLREFHPTELLFAQVRRFKPWDASEKFKTTEMAVFFRKAARDGIEAARLQKLGAPEWFGGECFRNDGNWSGKTNLRDLKTHWTPVIAAWNKYQGQC